MPKEPPVVDENVARSVYTRRTRLLRLAHQDHQQEVSLFIAAGSLNVAGTGVRTRPGVPGHPGALHGPQSGREAGAGKPAVSGVLCSVHRPERSLWVYSHLILLLYVYAVYVCM
jgi:hypothetical protein